VHHNFASTFYALGNDDFVVDYGRGGAEDAWFASVAQAILPPPVSVDSSGGGAGHVDGDVKVIELTGSMPFPDGGYFMQPLTDELFLVSLNTVVYAKEHAWTGLPPGDPYGQFEWLDRMLGFVALQAQGNAMPKVLIVGHIPPALNNYDFSAQWREEYVAAYMSLVDRHAHVVAGQLFGHLHLDAVRLMPSARVHLPIFVSGGISPVFENNPSFRVWKYKGAELLDYAVYGAMLDRHRPQQRLVFSRKYQALEAYGLRSLAAAEWRSKVAAPLLQNDTLWEQYLDALWQRYRGELHDRSLASKAFRVRSYCAALHAALRDFDACVAATMAA